jgi:hypothetical protein
LTKLEHADNNMIQISYVDCNSQLNFDN